MGQLTMYPPSRTINFGTPVAAVATRMTCSIFQRPWKRKLFLWLCLEERTFCQDTEANGMPVSSDPNPVYISKKTKPGSPGLTKHESDWSDFTNLPAGLGRVILQPGCIPPQLSRKVVLKSRRDTERYSLILRGKSIIFQSPLFSTFMMT